MFKIAYGAGHNDKTGNGIPEYLHKPFMNEWRLNDRIARYFEEAASQYEEVELLRVDEPEAPVDLLKRCKMANDWGADFFLSIHHNAGVNGGKGGGLVAFSNPGSQEGARYRDLIYDSCIDYGGLIGDRWDTTLETAFYVLKNTDMPAVLMEYGFMDSQTDAPVIVTDAYARAMAKATMEGIAKTAGLKKKAQQEEAPDDGTIYRVQVGAFKKKNYAKELMDDLMRLGYEAFIVEGKL